MGLLEARTEDAHDLPYIVIVSMMHSAVQANIDALGEEITMKLLAPYMRLNASFCIELFPKWVGHDGKGVERMLSAMNWTLFMSNRSKIMWRRTEEGAIELMIPNCRTGGQYQHMCEWWCDREHVLMCRDNNPDLTVEQVQRLGKGNDRCVWSIRKKHGALELSGLTTDFQDLPPPDTPVDTLDFWAHAGPAQFMTYATTNLIETIDHDKAINILITKAKGAGRELGAFFLNQEGVDGADPSESLLNYIDELMQMEVRETISDGETVQKTITKCPFYGCIPEVCMQIEAMRIGALEVVSPGSVVSFKESRDSDGCRWRLIKQQVKESLIKVEGGSDGMLQALKWRLAKGEIDKTEYQELYDLIMRR